MWPADLVDEGLDPTLRRVVHHGELLEDDLALLFDLLRGEERVTEHIHQDVHGQGEVGTGYLHPVDRQLTVGGGVEDAADALDGFGDLFCRDRKSTRLNSSH